MAAKNKRKWLFKSGLEDFDEIHIQSMKSMEVCLVSTAVPGSHHHVTLISLLFPAKQ
jgi:hypothetical protein